MAKKTQLSFQLHHCKNWLAPQDLKEALLLAVQEGQLIPLENTYVSLGDNMNARTVARKISEWLDENYRENNEWDEYKFEWYKYKAEFTAFLRTTLQPGWEVKEPLFNTIDIYVDARSFGTSYSLVNFSCTLFQQWQVKIRELSQLFLRIAFPVTERLQPTYAVITSAEQLVPYGRDILSQKLPYLFWCNYFGESYLQKFGTETFTTAPGWQVKHLGSGIWYQLTEHLSEPTEELLKKISTHFAPINENIRVR